MKKAEIHSLVLNSLYDVCMVLGVFWIAVSMVLLTIGMAATNQTMCIFLFGFVDEIDAETGCSKFAQVTAGDILYIFFSEWNPVVEGLTYGVPLLFGGIYLRKRFDVRFLYFPSCRISNGKNEN